MIERIKKISRMIIKYVAFGRIKPNSHYDNNKIEVDKSSTLQNLSIQIREDHQTKRLYIGSESLISGSYIFENKNGNIRIGDRTFIGGGSRFICIDSIVIGDDVMISWGCTVMDNDAHSMRWTERKDDVAQWKKGIDENTIGKYKSWGNVNSSPIVINNKAWIGFNVIILKGVTIGEGSVIAAGSVVTKNVSDYTLVGGNPATFIKHLER